MIALIKIISVLFQVYTYMILIRIFASWVPEFNNSRFVQFIGYYVDPYLNVFRQIIPPLGMLDLSPMAAIFALYFLEKILINVLVLFI
jgi:YggT family protein